MLRDIFSKAANNLVGIFRQSEKDIQKSREVERESERASEESEKDRRVKEREV